MDRPEESEQVAVDIPYDIGGDDERHREQKSDDAFETEGVKGSQIGASDPQYQSDGRCSGDEVEGIENGTAENRLFEMTECFALRPQCIGDDDESGEKQRQNPEIGLDTPAVEITFHRLIPSAFIEYFDRLGIVFTKLIEFGVILFERSPGTEKF